MACPFFEPLEPLVEDGFCPTERVTLGAMYRGRCTQGPIPQDSGFRPCNRGYARGICPNFPVDAPLDAYRFARVEETRIIWIEEHAHRPVQFGDTLPANAPSPLTMQFTAFQNSIKENKI